MYPRRHHEVVGIDDRDSEIEEIAMLQEPIVSTPLKRNAPQLGHGIMLRFSKILFAMEMELIRIAVGKKVATAECLAKKFDPNTLE